MHGTEKWAFKSSKDMVKEESTDGLTVTVVQTSIEDIIPV